MIPLLELLASLAIILSLGIGGFFLNVFLHELGHAIPILFWSKKKVIIYIGSLGDPARSFRVPVGRLEMYFKYNPFLWRRGMCRPGERLSVDRTIFYTAMGPLVSLLITATCLLILKTWELGSSQTVVLVTIMVIGGAFVLSSAIPRGYLHSTHSGKSVQNDATQIVRLWKTRNMPEAYWEACERYWAKDYVQAGELLEEEIGKRDPSVVLLRLAVAAHIQSGRYERAEVLLESIRERYRISMEDEINDGCLKIMTGRFREAIAINAELLRLHYNHFLILNNMGYALIAAGEPEEALLYLDRGLRLAPSFADLHSNRGLALMRLGQWEDGIRDTNHALKLEKTHADGYRNLGLYALEKCRNDEAKEHFLKAKSLDKRVQFVDDPLAEAERRLQSDPE
jgi:Tfp pilus assembly protein PilF